MNPSLSDLNNLGDVVPPITQLLDHLEPVSQRLHLLLDLSLLLLFLVDEVLDLLLLLVNAVHHLDQLGVGVVQMRPGSHIKI